MLIYETVFTFEKKFIHPSTVCRKATHHTSPQMFLSFPPRLYLNEKTKEINGFETLTHLEN